MPNFLLETFPKVLSIKSWSSSLHFTSWNILSKTLLFRNMSLFLRGGWVVKFLTLSHFCHMSLLGGGGWVLKEIWSMSLNNPFFFLYPSLSLKWLLSDRRFILSERILSDMRYISSVRILPDRRFILSEKILLDKRYISFDRIMPERWCILSEKNQSDKIYILTDRILPDRRCILS